MSKSGARTAANGGVVADRLLRGSCLGASDLWACVSPDARHVQSEVATSRLLASLRPFRDEAAAEAALRAAGAIEVTGGAV